MKNNLLCLLLICVTSCVSTTDDCSCLYPFKEGRLYGYKDECGRIVIPARYEDATSFSEGLATVEINGKWGYIDEKGEIAIPPRYYIAARFSEGLAAVSLDGMFGFIDKSGRTVIPFRYPMALDFSEGLAGVSVYVRKTRNGLIVNESGKWHVGEDEAMGYIDRGGNFVIGPTLKYVNLGSFKEGYAAVGVVGDEKDSIKYGFIDRSGKLVIEPRFDKVLLGFMRGAAMVEYGGKIWFLDKKGKLHAKRPAMKRTQNP